MLLQRVRAASRHSGRAGAALAARISRPVSPLCAHAAGGSFAHSSSTAPEKANMLITTPIFYVNASPHIGHVHSAVLADALSRWYTVKNRSVVFTTGTDEHGLKVQEAAENSGTTDYQGFCDDVSSRFDEIFQEANVKYSRFIRTSDPDHHEAVNALWRRIHENGFIYLGEHEAWYCKSDESFLTETQVEDKTDALGQTFKVSKESGHKVEKVREENYKFKLSALQDRLLEWLDTCAEEDVIVPKSRHNEVRAAVAGGLRDVSVSRLSDKIQWAIKVPDDANHCVYVWLDALTNYLTCAGYPGETSDTWPADYHIVGKDIIKFHAIYWPAFLMAAGLPLPKRIVAHAHWTVDNVKMSKSLGNVVDPHAMLAKYGSDFVRYFLLREGVLNDDGDFNTTLLEDRVNSELADTLGNLVSRSTGKSFLPGGVLPSAPLEQQLNDEDTQLIAQGQTLAARVEKHFETPDFSGGLKEIVFFLHDVNRYFSNNEPWVLAKQLRNSSDPSSAEHLALQERLNTVLYLTIDAVRMSAILLQPVVPESTTKILDYLTVPPAKRSFEYATMMRTETSSSDAGVMGTHIDNSHSFVAFPKLLNNTRLRACSHTHSYMRAPCALSVWQALLKENRLLKHTVEKLELENHDLKRSVYELTLKLDSGPLSRASSGSSSAGAASGVSASANASEPFQISDLLSTPKPSAQGDESAEYDRHAAALHGAKADEYDDDGRVLFQKSELRAHTGAVYTAKFSPCGRLLASGSLDTKVLLWDVTTKFNQQQLASLAQHSQLVIDVSWSEDSKTLVSASYDHTVKLWDVEKSQLTNSSEVPGLIQCVSFNFADNNQYFFGTSKGCIHQVDARADVVRTWQNDAMVNSLNVSPDGQFVITGDSKGMIKTWDVRMDSCIEDISKLNDAGHHAISHLHASPPVDGRRSGDEDGRFLAVNSYDNMLRVYDRRSKLISSSHGQEQMQLAFFVTGHKNKNWPIKSSFFRGEGYKYKLNLPSNRHTQRKLTDGDGEDFQDTDRPDAAQETLLLATGSADNKIYLHDVSLKHPNARPSPYLVQKIDAHSDRVYCVDFHPTEPILASASADYSIKIWLPRAPNTRLPKPKS